MSVDCTKVACLIDEIVIKSKPDKIIEQFFKTDSWVVGYDVNAGEDWLVYFNWNRLGENIDSDAKSLILNLLNTANDMVYSTDCDNPDILILRVYSYAIPEGRIFFERDEHGKLTIKTFIDSKSYPPVGNSLTNLIIRKNITTGEITGSYTVEHQLKEDDQLHIRFSSDQYLQFIHCCLTNKMVNKEWLHVTAELDTYSVVLKLSASGADYITKAVQDFDGTIINVQLFHEIA